MPEYLSSKKRKQSIGINSYSEYTDTTKIIGNVLVGFGSVGVGTTVPTQDVDVQTIRVRDTLYDYTNSGGEFGYYLVKDTDGIKWVAVPPIDSNAIFVAENNNILGVSSFTGLNIISDELIGVTTNPINPNFADITIVPRWLKSGETGIYTTKNVGIGTTIPTTDFQVGFGTTGVTIDGSVGVVSALGYYGNYAFIDQITVNDQLNVVGLGTTSISAFLASAGGITTTGGDLYVGGSLFADKLDIINLKVVNIEATGITTLNVGIVSTFRVTGVSTLGVTSTKDLFVDANLEVSGITTLGITSTKDLFVDENLYVVGIATATRFSTGVTGSAINITSNTISGPAEIIIDPADVGDNSGAVRIKGDLYVDGEEFIVNSTTIELADFNVGIASTVGTNFLLDGAGIGIGSTNIRKTLTYDFSSDALKSSENFDLETGKVYKINETEVLSSTQLTVANINATGVSTIGFATIGQLYVSGVSTFVGVGTFIEDLYVGGDLYVADDIFFDELTARNANITGITTLNVGIVSTFRVTGVSTLGVTSISQLNVSGLSTFVGVGTFINDLYVGEVLYADVVTGLTSTTDLLVDGNLRVTGISTLGVTTISQLNVSGITTLGVTTISQLNVSGVTTLGVTSATNLTSQQLNVTGITTLGVTSATNLTSQQLNVSGITTLGITTAQQLYVSGVSTFVGVGTFIDDLYVGKVLYAKTVDFDNIEVENIKATGISTLNVGIVSTLTVSGISTLGVTSATNLTSQQLNVSGITTLASIVGTSLSITGISTIANFLMTPVGTGATVGGIGVTYYGDGSQLTKISSSSGYADTAGIATYATSAGIATYATSAGIATYATSAGIATYATSAGIATYADTAGVSTTSGYATSAGISTYATNAGIATYATNAGIATYATNAGISTNLNGGDVGDIPYQSAVNTTAFIDASTASVGQVILWDGSIPYWGNVSSASGSFGGINVRDEGELVGTANSITTINFVGSNVSVTATTGPNGIATVSISESGIATYATNAGIATYATNAGIATYATNAGISTNVIGGIGSITQLQVTGISTFTNGPVLVGAATSTGTSAQRLQVTGGTYVSGSVGIGTTNPTSKLQVQGDVSIASTVGIGTVIDIVPYDTLNSGTLSFEGSAGQLFSITNNLTSGSIFSVNDVSGIPSIDVDANGTVSLVAYGGNVAIGSTGLTGTSAQRLQVTGGAYVSGNLGIGTTNPTQSLHIQGNARLTGALYDSTNVAGSSGQILQTTGSSVQWINASTTNVGSANSIGITLDSTNASRYLTFVSTTSGNNVVYVDSDLLYNPSTNSLGINTTSFTGTASQNLQVTGGAYVSGNLGIGTTNPQYKLQVVGDFAATTKSFVIPHPTEPGMKLRYGSLESPYHGIRLTGSSIIQNGSCIVNLPNYIHNFVKEEGVHINITNIKHGKVLWVEEVDIQKNKFIVMTEENVGEYEFYWDFTAIRNDIDEMIVEY